MERDEITAQANATRPCDASDVPVILRIINAAAEAYRGVIPADRWHEPYMPLQELRSEIANGVVFTGYVSGGELVGVMGIQAVKNVRLIRHAYVMPEWQGHGVGSRLITSLHGRDEVPVLIGTWRAASWAIRFYQRHGFALVPDKAMAPLLKTYWNIPERQVETSVVLASPILSASSAARLIHALQPPPKRATRR
jgi:GNAT superfamily N-acetyltransferase